MYYKGYTDIYVPFPSIATESAQSMKISPQRYRKLYNEQMDQWLVEEMGAEHAYDDRVPTISPAFAPHRGRAASA